MHSQNDVMTRIAKRAEMLKEVGGIAQLAKPAPAKSSWRSSRVDKTEPPSVAVAIESGSTKKAELKLEIAHTEAERRLGLGGRTALADNHGMLFTKAGAYWMKGVPFDLDIMFLDKLGCVLDMTTMQALHPGDYPEIYSSKCAGADMAVEVPAGWCSRNGIVPGDRITIINTHS